MYYSFSIFILFYFAIILSCLGYGIFISQKLENYLKIECLGFKGLIGIFFLLIYSYISHFIIPHGLLHNSILMLIGLLFFIYYAINSKFRGMKILFFTFSILFLSFLIFKTHDDFPYYHFPYTYNLTQNTMIIGIGEFNHGFRTPSSIFYLNSLFYMPLVSYNMFYVGAVLILGFGNIILLNNIFDHLKGKNLNYIFYFSLLSLAFINVFFYRLQEHGTDRSSQILVFLFFLSLLNLKNEKSKNNDLKSELIKIIILMALIISFKTFYILYLIFIFPIIYVLKKKKNLEIFFEIFKNPYFYLSTSLGFLVIMSIFFNTGCLIYPLIFTCFETIEWTIPLQQVAKMKIHYEVWSKAGYTPNFIVENIPEYISNFNWVSNWFNIYFFNKVSDFVLGLLFLSMIFIITFSNKNIKSPFNFKIIDLNYLFVFILFLEWFINHPALRYGGYVLISILIFLPVSLYLERFKFNKFYKIKIYFIIALIFIIFSGRNIDRIIKEHEFYNYNPFKDPYYRSVDNQFRYVDKFKELSNN